MSDEPEEKSTLAPNREFIERIFRWDSKHRPAVHEAYEERNRRLEQEWKATLRPTEVWGIASDPVEKTAVALHKAMMAYHESYVRDPRANDIELLLAAVRLPRALGLANAESFARLIELLHARGQPLKAGGPGAYLERWRLPQYVAALMAEIQLDVWRVQNRKQPVLFHERTAIVDKVAEQVTPYMGLGGYDDKEAFKERVYQLLNDPKSRRLGVPKSALEAMVDNAVKQAAEDEGLNESEKEGLRERLCRRLRLPKSRRL
jgi:hypothetical protein